MGIKLPFRFMSPLSQHLMDMECGPRLGWELWVPSFLPQGVSSNLDPGLGAGAGGRVSHLFVQKRREDLSIVP